MAKMSNRVVAAGVASLVVDSSDPTAEPLICVGRSCQSSGMPGRVDRTAGRTPVGAAIPNEGALSRGRPARNLRRPVERGQPQENTGKMVEVVPQEDFPLISFKGDPAPPSRTITGLAGLDVKLRVAEQAERGANTEGPVVVVIEPGVQRTTSEPNRRSTSSRSTLQARRNSSTRIRTASSSMNRSLVEAHSPSKDVPPAPVRLAAARRPEPIGISRPTAAPRRLTRASPAGRTGDPSLPA